MEEDAPQVAFTDRRVLPRASSLLGARAVSGHGRLGSEDVVPQAPRVRQRDLDLSALLEAVLLHTRDAPDHVLEPGLRERRACGDRDPAALADGELRHGGAADVLEGPEHSLGELGPGMRVRVVLSRHDEVRLHERAPEGPEVQLAQPLPHDRADGAGVVRRAVTKNDPRLAGGLHGDAPGRG